MKASRYLLVIALFTGLNSCMWGVPKKKSAAITKDTLVYTYQMINQRAIDCDIKPDSGCATVKIKYPVFNDQQKLNDSVIEKLITLFKMDDVNTSTTDLNTYGQSFINGFKKSKNHYHSIEYYKLKSYAKVIRQDSSLTTIEIDGNAIQDGFRENAMTSFINWNTKANSDLLLSELFINGYEEKLRQIGEVIFRKDEKLSDTASLKKNYFFKNTKFVLNHNFCITPLGIRFLYNDYEIKPFAAGQTNLLIPYTQIKSLLKSNTVITQYLK